MTVTKFTTTRHDVTFRSGDSFCAAWLFLPVGVDRPPVVVLGHGLGATREMRLDTYAECFARAGVAALAFTHRHLGDSGGRPRQIVSIRRQLADWESAIGWATSSRDVDGSRIALWGSSLGGGHVLTIAARHPELAAVVAQCPVTDGLASARELSPRDSLRLLPPVLRDLVAMALRRDPVMVPVVGAPGSAALTIAPGAVSGYLGLVPRTIDFRNEAAARFGATIAAYRPGRSVKAITAPVLFCIGEFDDVTPPERTERFANDTSSSEIRRYAAGHFDIYFGKPFHRAVADQTEFLTRHLAQHPSAATTIIEEHS